jgi:hypothetical protein
VGRRWRLRTPVSGRIRFPGVESRSEPHDCIPCKFSQWTLRYSLRFDSRRDRRPDSPTSSPLPRGWDKKSFGLPRFRTLVAESHCDSTEDPGHIRLRCWLLGTGPGGPRGLLPWGYPAFRSLPLLPLVDAFKKSAISPAAGMKRSFSPYTQKRGLAGRGSMAHGIMAWNSSEKNLNSERVDATSARADQILFENDIDQLQETFNRGGTTS